MTDGFLNPKDPIAKAPVPNNQRELFLRLSKACEGFSASDVTGAAANLIVNSLRQAHSTKDKAESSFDSIFGKTKQLLMDHYDSIIGRRKGIFPYDQVINVPHFDMRTKDPFIRD